MWDFKVQGIGFNDEGLQVAGMESSRHVLHSVVMWEFPKIGDPNIVP